MKLAGHYAGWVTLTVWRKKSTLLALALAVVIFIICLQYNVARSSEGDENDPNLSSAVQDKRTLLGGSVMGYVGNPSPNTPPLPASQEKILVEESPYRDDLGPQRNDRTFDGSVFDDVPSRAPYIPKQRLIHLDLKGAPPKVSYIKKIFKLSKDLGATGVLLEWEDMFPWHGFLKNVAATNAYTREEVKEILVSAKLNDMEVIPLIQTFGHVELALKLKDFKHLREVPDSAQALCPSLNASFDLIQTMIDQVMDLHPDSHYLHIGCDEVFQMGECSRCKTQPRDSLFLGHIAKVAGIVRSRYPKVTPIIWDDMLRHLPPSSLEQYRIGELVEPMVWVYAEDVYRFVPLPIWEKYAAIFPTVWAASAFKGAFGETLYIPNVKRHLDNNLRWLEVMANEGPKFKLGFQGVVITGWQRYDHFSVLCELLPAAIPSLAITLLATSQGYMNASLRTKINTHLNCGIFAPTTYFNLNNDPFLWDTYSRCTFPGHAFFKLTSRLNSAQKEAEELIAMIRKQKGWMTPYNVRHNFSTPLRVDELMQDQPRVYHTIASLARSARDALSDVFDIVTISEWVEQNIYPLVLELEEIQKDANALKSRQIWPRRPFPPLKDLTRLGVQTSDDDDDDIQVPPR